MIIVMKPTADKGEIDHVVERVEEVGCKNYTAGRY